MQGAIRMNWMEIVQLREKEKYCDITGIADQVETKQETDTNLIITVAEAYLKLQQYAKSIEWYIRALSLGTDEDVLTPLLELYRLTAQSSNAWDELYYLAKERSIPHNQFSMLKYEKLYAAKADTKSLIEVLSSYVEEELFDLHLIELAELYINSDNPSDAKKLLKKCIRFTNQDECFSYSNQLLEAMKEGRAKEILQSVTIRLKLYGGFEGMGLAVEENKVCFTKAPIKETEIPEKLDIEPEDNNKKSSVIKIQDDKPENVKDHGIYNLFQKRGKKKKIKTEIITSIEDLFKDVVGMQPVKEVLQSFYHMLQFQNSRKLKGLSFEILKTNFVVTGERGSGKTLVANCLSSLLDMFGVIGNERIIEVSAREIQEVFTKSGTKGLLELFSEITDAVVVIDNMERLYEENETEKKLLPLSEGIAELMEARKDSLVIIMTGTKSFMEAFISDDIKKLIYATLDIPAYTAVELVQLIYILAEKKQFSISSTASKMLLKRIQMERCLGEFTNTISLNSILDEAIKKKAARYMSNKSEADEAMRLLEEVDFEMQLEEEESIEELLKKLEGLTGLQSVKQEVKSKLERMIAQQQALELGSNRSGDFGTLHMVFKGSPGTGKTTIARILGKIYQQLGVLPRGNIFVECTRKDLVGEYQGHTAVKTHKKFMEALGGILFIDEAYSLVQGNGDSFGLEALNTLLADIENHRDSIMVILAGYSNEMDEFLLHNPGMSSRISNEILFEDYSTEEMAEIFSYMVKERGMVLDRNTSDALRQLIDEKAKVRDFGNARGVRNLVDRVINGLDKRVVEMQQKGEILGKNDYEIVKAQDIEAVCGQKTDKEKSLEDLMNELNAMTGLASVKHQVQQMVAMIRLKQKSEELKLGTKEAFGSLHLVFKGNAGTGKTTIARLLGQIYEKLGVLKKGDVFVECSRASLIGQYQGQTTKKVEDKVKVAEGGILFIDEAYDLCHSDNDDFGKEIVSTLLKAIEDKRDNLMVIMAGYDANMEEFFKTNQGLKSRMANEINFEDYTIDELTEIFYYMAQSNNLRIEEGLEPYIKEYIKELMRTKTDFGNARGVRNLYEEVMRKRALRLSEVLDTKQFTRDMFVTIIRTDFK
jgi:AAA+ superfamily predicted ATPase